MSYHLKQDYTKSHSGYSLLIYILILLGIGLRLFHYFHNRSLWMDEVYLSSSLVRMDYLQLATQPLDYQQKAPIGFLWTVKTFLHLLGNKEMALRLFSLISGIISLFVFVPVAKYFLRPIGAVVAIGILALAPPLVYHSVEVKQYACELLATILLLYTYIKYHNERTVKKMLIWGCYGAIITWFSYSAVFILAGIAAGSGLYYLLTKRYKAFLITLIPGILWMTSFGINYLLFTHKHAESQWIAYWFRSYDNFMPLTPFSLHGIKWFFTALYQMIDYPLGLLWNSNLTSVHWLQILLKLPFIAIGLLITGIYAFFNDKKTLLILGLSVMCTLLASGLELYPLTERFWVFIAPVFILLIARGCTFINERFVGKKLQLLLPVIVLFIPFSNSLALVAHTDRFLGHKKSFQREALLYVDKHFQEGDIVYVYWNNLPGYKLYKNIYHLDFPAIEGKDLRQYATNYTNYFQQLQQDFTAFKGHKRVWLIYNDYFQTDIGDKIDEPAWYYTKNAKPTHHLVTFFNSIGKEINTYKTFDVHVRLFETNDK